MSTPRKEPEAEKGRSQQPPLEAMEEALDAEEKLLQKQEESLRKMDDALDQQEALTREAREHLTQQQAEAPLPEKAIRKENRKEKPA